MKLNYQLSSKIDWFALQASNCATILSGPKRFPGLSRKGPRTQESGGIQTDLKRRSNECLGLKKFSPAKGGPPAMPRDNRKLPSPKADALRFSSTVNMRREFIVVIKMPSPTPYTIVNITIPV